MGNLLIVMTGGAIGAAFRYQVGRAALAHMGPGFPWATLVVNLLGGLLMGVLAAQVLNDGSVDRILWLFLGVGVLGGFTTFSAFSLELFTMLQKGQMAVAGAYAIASVAGSLMLLIAGYWAVRTA